MDTPDFRQDFPLLRFEPNTSYIYFDSASTTLKPDIVVNAFADYYSHYTSNIHRSTHLLAEQATIAYETTRENVASFIKADKNEIVFTVNCTDALNLVPKMINLRPEDEVIISVLEHHSNYLPWRQSCKVKMIDCNSDGVVDLEALERAITPRTKVIACTYVSNVTGNVQPVAEIAKIARQHKVLSLIDAAQAVGHFPVDTGQLGCDFLVFSGHKMLGPSGVGVLYCKKEILNELPPVRFGGGMINKISDDHLGFKPVPYCFEPGTPNIENVIAFGKAIEYFQVKGFDAIEAHLRDLEQYFQQQLRDTDAIHLPFRISSSHVPIFTFQPKNRTMDLNQMGRILSDTYGIAISVGVQCCQPLYQLYQIDGAIRASLYVYNTREDVDRFFDALKSIELFI